jgi:predicted transcriptional regulator
MANLFQLRDEYLEVISMLEESGGELTPEIEERLNINKTNVESKLKAMAHIIDLQKGDIATIDTEIERLNSIKTVKTNIIERVKDLVKIGVLTFGEANEKGGRKIKYDTVQFWTVNTNVVVIDNEEEFINQKDAEPYVKFIIKDKLDRDTVDEFKRYYHIENVEPNILKKELNEDIKNGVEIEGVRIDRQSCYVRIK